ncbi:TrkH family potassium uptake protein [Sneathiella limimaris]|uniref:TrkH family potassium uptake protein n=1 Tax=Sneathiella limimaris TaxID=1964213 RepID=UPI00146DBDCD|nr:TrkH family potassium uptake protein [Sneathiella limimaris]
MVINPVMTILGWSLSLLAALMAIPCLFALERSTTGVATAFFVSAIITLFFGGALIFASRGERTVLNRRNTFLVTTLVWVVIPMFAALPFYLSGTLNSPVDAYFEALSGFSTNGASVFVLIEELPKSIILWRALLQWFGGFAFIIFLSILVSAISIPGSSPLSKALARSTRRRMSRRVRDAILSTLSVYAILTGLCIVFLWFTGLSAFNALCYAFSTISTGGFTVSSHGAEIFENRMTELVLMVFMFIGSINFALHWAFFNGNRRAYFDNPEYRYFIYVFLILLVTMMIMLYLETDFTFIQSLRYAVFNVISFLSTTGYQMDPVAGMGEIYWPIGALLLLMIAITIGGSTGSTAGGLKLMRVAILFKLFTQEVRSLSYPSAVSVLRYSKDKITNDNILSVWALVTFYAFTITIVTLCLSLADVEVESALAMATATLATAGAAVSPELVGQTDPAHGIYGYGGLPDAAKLLLCATMILGRLEFFAVLALFNPALWKR